MRSAVLAAAAAVATTAAVYTTAVASDRPTSARAELHLAGGTPIGTVRFRERRDAVRVDVSLAVPPGATAVQAFHGFHVHANDNPANGTGCIADPAALPATWFVSADGHFARPGESHGAHAGDLPSLVLNADGTATTTFEIDRLDIDDLTGRTVIVHAGPDNFGNVPVGTAPLEYTPNSADALSRTRATGNSGDRVACGEISTR